MKVIVAGHMKTGTKSTNAALTELGYEVYDYLEHFWFHENEWKKIITCKDKSDGDLNNAELFKSMYENVDVTIDCPSFCFWEEIFNAFPDAKVILTIRDEDSWYKSLCKQNDELTRSRMYQLMLTITPTGRRLHNHRRRALALLFGHHVSYFAFMPFELNELHCKEVYRRHNAHVELTVPRDQLLVYSVKEGWDRLCGFLGREAPGKPFPHKNVGGEAIKLFMETHVVMKTMKAELCVSIGVLFGVAGLCGFVAFKRFS